MGQWYFWICSYSHMCNIKHCPEVGLFRNKHLITVLSSVLMLYLLFSNLNWMPLIQSVFSGAHTCTQSSNLKEEIWLFIFVFRFPTFWHSRQRPAFEWGFWVSKAVINHYFPSSSLSAHLQNQWCFSDGCPDGRRKEEEKGWVESGVFFKGRLQGYAGSAF